MLGSSLLVIRASFSYGSTFLLHSLLPIGGKRRLDGSGTHTATVSGCWMNRIMGRMIYFSALCSLRKSVTYCRHFCLHFRLGKEDGKGREVGEKNSIRGRGREILNPLPIEGEEERGSDSVWVTSSCRVEFDSEYCIRSTYACFYYRKIPYREGLNPVLINSSVNNYSTLILDWSDCTEYRYLSDDDSAGAEKPAW